MLSTDSTDILFSKARSHKAWLDQDINDNQIVMGYPAIPLKEFLKNRKK